MPAKSTIRSRNPIARTERDYVETTPVVSQLISESGERFTGQRIRVDGGITCSV